MSSYFLSRFDINELAQKLGLYQSGTSIDDWMNLYDIIMEEFFKIITQNNANSSPTKWISASRILNYLEATDIGDASFSIKLLEDICKIFSIGGLLTSNYSNGNYEYQINPSHGNKLSETRNRLINVYPHFHEIIQELTSSLFLTLKMGRHVLNPASRELAILWESLHNESIIFRHVLSNIEWDKKQFENQRENKEISIANINVQGGKDTIAILNQIVNENENITINVFCFDQSPTLLNRAMDNLSLYKREIGDTLHKNNVELNYNFSQISFDESFALPESSIDLFVINNLLQIISQKSRDEFLRQISSILSKNGMVLMTQFTSYSENEIHPISLFYMPFIGYSGLPTYEELKELAKKYFKEVKYDDMHVNWKLRKPKK